MSRVRDKLNDLLRRNKKRTDTMLVGLVCLAFSCALMVLRIPFLDRIDSGIYDVFLRSMAGGEPSPIPVLVDIDERSINELGQWPWPRYRMAELLIALGEYGVASMGVDILMTEPDRTSPALWMEQLKEDFGVEPDIQGLPEELMNNDDYLASIIAQLPVVMSAQLVSIEEVGRAPDSKPKPLTINQRRAPGAGRLEEYLANDTGILMPVPSIAEASTAIALMNAEGDSDGVFRRVPLFAAWNGTAIASLALATLAVGAGENGVVVYVSMDGPVAVDLAGIEIPVSHGGTMPVAFRGGGGTYPVYSAVDVLRGAVSEDALAGRIAFIGSTSTGLKDLRPTPFDGAYPGLELHAAAVDTILSGRFIRTPIWSMGYIMILILATGTISMILFSVASPRTAIPAGAIMAACVWFGSRYLMVSEGYFVTPLYALITIFLEAFVSFSLRFLFEESEKRVLRRAFSNYVAPEVVGKIMETGGVASLEGQQRDISVLFTDLRGFTSLTEKMPPKQVVAMLGSYFTPMTSIVRNSMGTLDKFVGDALMAFWNAPTDVPDHPYRAVRSLLDMHIALGELNVKLEPEFGMRLMMGGGIHTGAAHVGNMGTSELMDYTAIGDTVNTASRLEGMCSKYGVGVVISKDTADLCGGKIALKPLDLVRVKGRTAGIPIFTVRTFEEAESEKEEMRLWEEAFSLYIGGDFVSSGKICSSLARDHPEEKLYRIFAERTEMMAGQISENWDGVFIYESK
ncbi:MAG: adenylate/guanylate cyclase domain-containing protein [Synergistaceae bacterium]|jgi:adenylate cyclase|nr:adenylate/guanylate cyclase domain-containing protein [Synergistaceae bacterium]